MNNINVFSDGLVRKNSLLSRKLEVRNAMSGERGVFAVDSIELGEIIGIQGGRIFSSTEYHALSADLQRYPLQIDDGAYIGLDDRSKFDMMEYINHGCDPNVGIWGMNVFVAMRPIVKGEELRYDYAMSDTTDADMGWECACGSSICRKRITPQDWQLSELQKRYGRFFSQYILDKIQAQILCETSK